MKPGGTNEPPFAFICNKSAYTVTIDKVTAHYLNTKAEAVHKTPSEIIGEMVREKIAML